MRTNVVNVYELKEYSGLDKQDLAKIHLGTLSRRKEKFSLALSWRLGWAMTQGRIQDKDRWNGNGVREMWIRDHGPEGQWGTERNEKGSLDSDWLRQTCNQTFKKTQVLRHLFYSPLAADLKTKAEVSTAMGNILGYSQRGHERQWNRDFRFWKWAVCGPLLYLPMFVNIYNIICDIYSWYQWCHPKQK